MATKNSIVSTDDIAKEVVAKKKRERKEQQVITEPGDNTKYISHSLTISSWPNVNIEDVNQVNDRITKYFQLCAENDMKPSVEGLALAFGTNRVTLWRWINGVESKHVPQEVRNTLKKAHSIINNLMVEFMQNGKINPVAGIFLMKNNMAYTDTTEVVVTPNNPLGTEDSAEGLQKRIESDLIVDVD